MTHYIRLFVVQFRISVASAIAYRWDFLLEGVMSSTRLAFTLLPLFVVYTARKQVNGWDAPSALIVTAYFTAVRAVLEGVVSPSLVALVDQIRSGAFDYVLLKPVDSQAIVSTARHEPWKIFDVVGALAIFGYAFKMRGYGPAPADLALGSALFVTGVVTMYALWIMCAAASFWVGRLDNLIHLLESIFETARWPVQLLPEAWRFVFTFVIPIALMTTFPAMALLGRLDAIAALETAAGALGLLALGRLVWRAAIRNYTSASS